MEVNGARGRRGSADGLRAQCRQNSIQVSQDRGKIPARSRQQCPDRGLLPARRVSRPSSSAALHGGVAGLFQPLRKVEFPGMRHYRPRRRAMVAFPKIGPKPGA
tara:strand:- start:6476 stop:6787 length:312 start_codon:yes stop_codon:yes gene_type:complete